MLGVDHDRPENDDKFMPTDLFSRLFRYRPTHGRVPWEDWFTESFAAVLNRYPNLGAAYAGFLIGRDVETAAIETQRTFSNARPDMWVDAHDTEGRRHVVMVEHKMGAPAEAPQLRAYERRLQSLTAETRTLVHIAGSSAPPGFEVTSGDVKLKCFAWFQIYRWLARWTASAQSGQASAEFVDELLKFMEKWGMTIEISMNELVAATAYRTKRVEQRLLQIMDSAWDEHGMTDALGETDGGWKTDVEYHRSPRIVRHGVHVEYGFDFFREDAEWDVSRLQMPSAWVGIWMPEVNGTCTLACPSGWKEPPKTWDDNGEGRWVWGCEIEELRLRGESLSALYLEFFTGAFTALKTVL